MYKRRYVVRGINPDTKRQNKRDINAFDEAHCRILAAKEGLNEPIEILEVIEVHAATEKQVEYARKRGIRLPDGINYREAFDFTSLTENQDSAASESLRRQAQSLEIEYSDYTGAKDLSTRILRVLPLKDQIAFYLLAFASVHEGRPIVSLDDAPQRKDCADFGEEMAKDEKFVSSFNSAFIYSDDNHPVLFGSYHVEKFFSSRAYAFEKMKHYLRYKFDIKPKRSSRSAEPVERPSAIVGAGKNGCLGMVMVAAVLIAAFFLLIY
jgi:hypothetical protein